jgi:hypothetical protein
VSFGLVSVDTEVRAFLSRCGTMAVDAKYDGKVAVSCGEGKAGWTTVSVTRRMILFLVYCGCGKEDVGKAGGTFEMCIKMGSGRRRGITSSPSNPHYKSLVELQKLEHLSHLSQNPLELLQPILVQ